MKYGYVRVSTKGQNPERQFKTMKKLGIKPENIFLDTASGKNFDREGYAALKDRIKSGDILYIDSLDRLGRNYDAIIQEWKSITRTIHCDIIALDNTGLFDSKKFREMGDIGRLLEDQMLSLLAYVADTERKKTLERQKQGIDVAKENGVKFGRPLSIIDWDLFDRIAAEWVKGRLTVKKACELSGAKRSSWYKYTKERGFYKTIPF